MTEEGIKRINELYHKSKDVGLTPEEKEEQARLRQEYIQSVRNNLKSMLDNIEVVDCLFYSHGGFPRYGQVRTSEGNETQEKRSFGREDPDVQRLHR